MELDNLMNDYEVKNFVVVDSHKLWKEKEEDPRSINEDALKFLRQRFWRVKWELTIEDAQSIIYYLDNPYYWERGELI